MAESGQQEHDDHGACGRAIQKAYRHPACTKSWAVGRATGTLERDLLWLGIEDCT
jgi:hypothetical protein